VPPVTLGIKVDSYECFLPTFPLLLGWLELFYSVVNGRSDEDMELEGIVKDSKDDRHVEVEVKEFKEELILVC